MRNESPVTDLQITEAGSVQFPMVRHAAEIGWTAISPQQAMRKRGSAAGMLFRDDLGAKLARLNPWMTEVAVRQVIERLEAIPPSIEGNREVLAWLRGERQVYDEAEERNRRVRLVDFESPAANSLHVTWEWRVKPPARKGNRADVMFVVNGVPVAIVEHKNPKDANAIERGVSQLRRYEQETPELIAAPQLFNVTHLLEYWYGVTWNATRRFMARWKEKPEESYKFAVQAFFEPTDFLRTLERWILFYVEDGETRKSVLRQHQRVAIGKVVERCEDRAKRRGLIWHTQGSGKTFTLLTAARLILEDKQRFANATVLLVVDRTELEGQLKGWVERLLGEMQQQEIPVWQARSKDEVQDLLRTDKRGLIISMIHKFEGIDRDANTRGNIYVFIDEAHRSVARDLGTYMMAAVPNATIIGFTGTPVARTAQGEGTFKIFGLDDELGYLDKYSIRESIEDETTLPLRHTMAPNEMTVPVDQLDREFFELAEAEGVTDVDELNRVLDRAVGLRTFLTADERIEKVAAFVADHFKENVLPLGYKAFLVGVNREACAKYKRALDRLLPAEWSEAVYTADPADVVDRPLVAELQLSPEREAEVRLTFKKTGEDPKILIVTDKLLTGYDAPLLYCMYLDKPMRDHVLLQAIARVNRPFVDAEGGRKRIGLVVDFVGVLRELQKALRFDSSDVSGVIEDLDLLLEDCVQKIGTGEVGVSCRRQEWRGGRAPGAAGLRPLPQAGVAQGLLRSLQGDRGALGNPVAFAGVAGPRGHLQAAGRAVHRPPQRLRRAGPLRGRPRPQDARPRAGQGHPGEPRRSGQDGDLRRGHHRSPARRSGLRRGQDLQPRAGPAGRDRQQPGLGGPAPTPEGARRAYPRGSREPQQYQPRGPGPVVDVGGGERRGGQGGEGERPVSPSLRRLLDSQGR